VMGIVIHICSLLYYLSVVIEKGSTFGKYST
jgi:hypothetical protein